MGRLTNYREVLLVRSRRLFPFAAVAVAALALTGCASGAADSAATPSASSTTADTASTSLCDMPPAAGAFSDAVTINGEIGAAPTITIDGTPTVTELERTVAVEGTGPAIADGSYVKLALTAFDGATGEMSQSVGYGDSVMPAEQITAAAAASNPNYQVLGCATEGSRLVIVSPAADAAAAAQVFVFDVLDVIPDAEWCAVVDENGAMPTVTFADSGEPTITIPKDTAAPAGVQLEVLKPGDGEVVGAGDTVTVEYTGVKWSDGTTFDSSWQNDEDVSFPTTGVVAGFKRALEGQKVGSTVAVTMSPECGYGESETAASGLGGQTLVFVVDILKTDAAQ